jgi:hypothetical protein
VAEAHQARQAAAQLVTPSPQNSEQSGRRRRHHFEQWENDEIEVKLISGWRLREQEYPVFPARQSRQAGPGRPQSGRCSQVLLHAVGKAQGQGCAPGRARGLHRAATARTVMTWRRSSCSARWMIRIRSAARRTGRARHEGSQHAGREARWASEAVFPDWMQIGVANRFPRASSVRGL